MHSEFPNLECIQSIPFFLNLYSKKTLKQNHEPPATTFYLGMTLLSCNIEIMKQFLQVSLLNQTLHIKFSDFGS